jgi:acetyl esterase
MAWFVELYARTPADTQDPRFSPVRAPSVEGVAPTTLLVAGYDINRDSALRYAERLRAAGGSCDADVLDSLPHGFASMAGFISSAQEPLERGAAALREALK